MGIAITLVFNVWLFGFLGMEILFHLQDWRAGFPVFGDEGAKLLTSLPCPVTVWSLNWKLIIDDLRGNRRWRGVRDETAKMGSDSVSYHRGDDNCLRHHSYLGGIRARQVAQLVRRALISG